MADGARVTAGEVGGWRSVALENDELRVIVLPDKGAEIHQIVDLRSGTEILFKGPWGLRPPGAAPLPGSGDDAFMWNYAGGWQELFPSVNAACAYRGHEIPFHGEVASQPWQHEVLESDGDEIAVRFWTRSRRLAVSPRTCAPSSRRRGDARDRGDGRQRVLGGCPFRLGAPLRGRAAVPRGGVQARDPRPHDRHRRPSSGSPTRRGSSRAAASRGPSPRCGPAAPSIFARCPGPRREATTIST